MKKLTTLLAALVLAPSAFASFHAMQIEELIGGVDGDPLKQAIQLRLRGAGHNLVSQGRLRAWDAAGANPILLLDITSNVTGSAAGARILLTTAAFTAAEQLVTPSFTPDFTLTDPIPASYLAAGKITFESDGGIIYWSLAWGGAAYTGTNTGNTLNDTNGNFGAAFASALPTSTRQGVIFDGPAGDLSTTNAADYILTANPATVFKNNGTSFTVVPEPGTGALLALAACVVGGLRRRSRA